MAQDVKLKIGGDTSELERAFSALIKKIQGDADKLKIGPNASKTAPGIESVREASQTSRALNQRIREEKAGLDIINRELSKKKALIDEIAKRQETTLKGSREELALAQRLNRERERLQQTQKIAQIQQENFRKTQEAADRATGKGAAGGASGSGFGGLPLGIAAPATLLAGVFAAVKASQMAEGARRFFAESPLRAREVEASAFQTRGQAGQRLQSLFGGGASEELMFNAQRAQAASFAQSAIRGRYSQEGQGSPASDIMSFLLGNEGAGALQHGQFTQAFRAIGGRFGNQGLQKEFESTRDLEQANLQSSQFDALKNGPEGALRTTTGNKFLSDYQRNLAFQRQTGLSEGGFRNFLGGVNGAGFSDEQGMGMSSSIQGAGGSTRSARGNAAFALQMQRSFDLTNSGQAIGAISGQLGSAQLSKDALIRIQAEGTRIGVNQSDFREENRKFVEMAANVINQSNVTSGAGVEQLVSTLGKFVGSNTISGQQAGLSAYQAYQSQSNIQSGPSAAMRAAGMMKDPNLGKLSGEDQAALFTMNQADVNADDPGIQAMAKKAGLTPQQFVDRYHGVQDSSLFQRKSTDMAISAVASARASGGLVPSGAMGPNAPGTENLVGEAQNRLRIEEATKGLSGKAQLQFIDAQASGNTGEAARLLQESIKTSAAAGQTGRPGDEMERQQAEAARLANGLFTSFRDSITPASAAVRDFATSIDALLKAMSGDASQRAAALQRFNAQYPGTLPTNQPSAGPPANGAGPGSR